SPSVLVPLKSSSPLVALIARRNKGLLRDRIAVSFAGSISSLRLRRTLSKESVLSSEDLSVLRGGATCLVSFSGDIFFSSSDINFLPATIHLVYKNQYNTKAPRLCYFVSRS